MLFLGEFEVSFSAPGRIVLPKRIRELLKGGVFILTKGYNNCLAGYDESDWEQSAKELIGASHLEKEQIEKRRFIFSSTVYLEIDDQGRFVIPKNMLQYASLDKKALIVGVGDHFEIWNIEQWKEYIEKVEI